MTETTIEFRKVGRSYGSVKALDGVSFIFTRGQPAALLGPSGCGKSTALRLIAGLEPPSAGEILLDGQLVSRPEKVLLPAHRRNIALVFQDLALWPNLTALGNVVLGLAGADLSRAEVRNRAAEALDMCHIADLAHRRPGQLSGGQQQRIALARAMAVRPRILLLDEPFAGLDPVTKFGLFKEISALANARGILVVLVTHDPSEALALCRCAVILDAGRSIESGTLVDLFRHSQSGLMQAFRDSSTTLKSVFAPDVV